MCVWWKESFCVCGRVLICFCFIQFFNFFFLSMSLYLWGIFCACNTFASHHAKFFKFVSTNLDWRATIGKKLSSIIFFSVNLKRNVAAAAFAVVFFAHIITFENCVIYLGLNRFCQVLPVDAQLMKYYNLFVKTWFLGTRQSRTASSFIPNKNESLAPAAPLQKYLF